MKHTHKATFLFNLVIGAFAVGANGQGTFQNLDFENGIFVPIFGDPYGSVQWSPAMPGWTGYLGANQVDRLLYNNLFLGLAGIAIWGPDNPSPNLFHGHNYVVLQRGLDPSDLNRTIDAAISQTGTIPLGTRSIRFYSYSSLGLGIQVLFNGSPIPMFNLGTASNGRGIWGGDVSSLADLTGELKFQGTGHLDYIQFSDQPIPEPSALELLLLGTLLLGWRVRRCRDLRRSPRD